MSVHYEARLCLDHLSVHAHDLDTGHLEWKGGDSAHVHVVEPKDCEMCQVSRETICTECGDDLVCEGYDLCSECLEAS